eukprot:SRR837773.776.p2 GENE.SRR837773.776~~SRR837773.776.p2  ORF type:complete len:362 (+),score=147.35 SRR837773.776:73-1158(+)
MAEIENRIFVSNVPPEASQDVVAAHFAQFGLTTDVYLPRLFGTDRHKGIAYITFGEAAAKEYALAHPSHDILGHQVSVQVCLPKGQGKGAAQGGGGENRIFVQGIGQEVMQDEVQAYFSQFGGWSDFYMPKGSYPAGHKGMCFISFESPESLSQVMNAGPHIIGGMQVTVDRAIARDAKGGGKGFGKAGGKPGMGMGGFQAPQQLYQPPPQHQHQQYQQHYDQQYDQSHYQTPQQVYQPPQHHHGASQYNSYGVPPPPQPVTAVGRVMPGRLFLTKMAPGLTKEDLEHYFGQFGSLNDVYIPTGKLIAFIGYSEPTIAESVAAMHTHEVRPGMTVCAEPAIERGAGGKGKDKGKGKGYSPY